MNFDYSETLEIFLNPELFLAYLIAVAVLVAVPGPNIMLIMNDSIRCGFRKSVLTILGITAGTSFLVCLSLIGLTALLALFSWIFTIIKWAGVCYLLYLGIFQIISSFKGSHHRDLNRLDSRGFFLKGFMVSATNPKGLLFASAFFPQFINEQLPIAPQIIILITGFLIVSIVIEILYAYAGDTTGRIFKNERFQRMTERISGVFLIMFGIGLSFIKEKS